MIRTPTDLRKAITDAETAAAILRTPGHRFAGAGERERIAALLAGLADIARRAFDPHARQDWGVTTQPHIADDATVPGLFDAGAAL